MQCQWFGLLVGGEVSRTYSLALGHALSNTLPEYL